MKTPTHRRLLDEANAGTRTDCGLQLLHRNGAVKLSGRCMDVLPVPARSVLCACITSWSCWCWPCWCCWCCDSGGSGSSRWSRTAATRPCACSHVVGADCSVGFRHLCCVVAFVTTSNPSNHRHRHTQTHTQAHACNAKQYDTLHQTTKNENNSRNNRTSLQHAGIDSNTDAPTVRGSGRQPVPHRTVHTRRNDDSRDCRPHPRRKHTVVHNGLGDKMYCWP